MANHAMSTRGKKVMWAGLILLLLAGMATAFWVRKFHRYTPVEAVLDLRAAAQVRTNDQPVARFMVLRYGSQSEPENRQKAFLDFFNVGHIEGLHMITQRMPPEMRTRRIQEMAQWVADYRHSMSPVEKQRLAAYLQTENGQRTLREATAKYLSQDVYYRAQTAPVISELMATLTEVKTP